MAEGAVAEAALAEAVAEEVALAEAVVVSVIPVEVPVRFKAVNPAVVQVVLEGVVKVSRIVKAVGVLEAGNLEEVVPAVFVILAEAPFVPRAPIRKSSWWVRDRSGKSRDIGGTEVGRYS